MSRDSESFVGIVHRDENDVVWFGDVPVRDADALPRRKSWASTLWYADATVRPSDLTQLLGPEDEAFGPAPGQVRGVKIRAGSSRVYRIATADSWGVFQRDPEVADREIRELRMLAEASGMRVKTSAATTALTTYLDRWDGDVDHPSVHQLPCRWRAMAHAAFHGGPIAVLRGGAPNAVQIDVRRAYLDALYAPVPVLGTTPGGRTGGYYVLEDATWDQVRKRDGFVEATVRVHSDPTGLPPLPIHKPEGVVYPNGHIRGCWVISQVREAEERGQVTVETVHQNAIAREMRPLFAEIADYFGGLPDKIAKISYQRYWARWGNPGGWTGMYSEAPRVGEVPANRLWWRYEGVTLFDPAAPRTYRPDIAAFIASLNHRRVMRVLSDDIAANSVAAVHVDAIWTTDVAGAHRVCERSRGIGGWREKRSGPLRVWSAGCYDHAGDVAASGYDQSLLGAPTRERVERWVSSGQNTHRRLLLLQRDWVGDPANEATATSTAPVLMMDTTIAATNGPLVSDPMWTFGGWVRPDHRPSLPPWAQEQAEPPESEEVDT